MSAAAKPSVTQHAISSDETPNSAANSPGFTSGSTPLTSIFFASCLSSTSSPRAIRPAPPVGTITASVTAAVSAGRGSATTNHRKPIAQARNIKESTRRIMIAPRACP